jgi:hypothetical protein
MLYRSYVIIKTPNAYALQWDMFQSFTLKIWIVVGFTMALLSVSLASINFMIQQHGLQEGGDYTLTKFIFTVFGAYCQKGNRANR